MINIKDQVFSLLDGITDNVTDVYPKNAASMPAIQYTEEDNHVYEWTAEGEQRSYVRYRIDIWNIGSTSLLALEVDKKLSGFGLQRIACSDIEDPNGFRHKVMRYEAIIDVDGFGIYHAD
ncbi:MAG: hypothetical protein E7290_15755 [Lachnospiraceae bacterium]|nr:hypothetical protein [Lachnospiraceae bacterium]